jgi:ABC-2 type transport system permease protein
MTTSTTSTVLSEHRDPGFAAAFGAEWAKLRSARGTRRNLVVASVLGLGLTALVAAVVGATYDDLTAAERADFHPSSATLVGMTVPWLFLTVMGVKVVTSEYASGMIRLTLTATPRRGRVLVAKALAITVLTWTFAAASTAAMMGLTQVILVAYDAPAGGLGDGDALRALVAAIVLGPVFPVVAVAVAVVLRNTAAALGAVLALAFAPSVLGMLPGWWQRNVLSLFPGPASDSLTVGHLESSDLYLHPLAAAVVVAAWLAAALAVAHVSFTRRDA